MPQPNRIDRIDRRPLLSGFLVLTAAIAAGCGGENVASMASAITAAATEAVSEAADSVDASAKAAPTRDAGEPATASTKRTYYQFVDEQGSVRFVDSLEGVPAAQRATAGRVEMASAPPTTPADRRADLERRKARARAVLAANPARRASDDVVLYYADWCGYCRKAKSHLDGRGVDYDLRNVDQPAIMAELQSKTGSGSIPVIEVGEHLIRGYDPRRMDRLIAAR